MRGGAGIGCVVNAAAGREPEFADAKPPQGERIAVIGAGPAGLTYASLVAEGNEVTVFEKDRVPGGAFRLAGKAPLFQGVEASERSFERYVADLVAACTHKGVAFKYGVNVARQPALLAPFDRIVVATGARYRYGLGPLGDQGAAMGRRPLAVGRARAVEGDRPRLVLLPGAPAHGRPFHPPRPPRPDRDRDRRRGPPGQEQGRDRQRLRGRVVATHLAPAGTAPPLDRDAQPPSIRGS